MSDYILANYLAVPEIILESAFGAPATYGPYLAYSVPESVMAQIVADWEVPVVAEGEEPISTLDLILGVGRAMVQDVAIIKLNRADCHRLLGSPHWRIFIAAYTDKHTVQADAMDALGLDLDGRKSLENLIIDARAALMAALRS